jgi:hypothetical protein
VPECGLQDSKEQQRRRQQQQQHQTQHQARRCQLYLLYMGIGRGFWYVACSWYVALWSRAAAVAGARAI